MKLRVVTLFAVLGLSCYAPAAFAQGTPTQPPPSTSTPTQPPPNVVVITPQGQTTVPGQAPVPVQPGTLGPVPPDKVRVHLRSYRPKDTARLYIEQGTDRWALACTSPCGIDLSPGASLRVTYNDDVDNPHDFSLQTEGGREIQLLVKPASKGALAGGIVMISAGGVTALCGLIVLALSDLSRSSERGQVRLVGGVVTALGAGLVIGGIVLLANRSREPRTTQESTPPGGPPPAKGAIDVPVRSAFVDDGKLATAPSTTSILPAPSTPLGWGFTF